MAVVQQLDHEFVDYLPDDLEEGTLYVSIRFGTVAHLCACGCGNQAVTPLGPTDYKLTYDGETITLHPSIGNWNFPCRSHYLIRSSRVVWAGDWTDDQIASGRARDRHAKDRLFGELPTDEGDATTLGVQGHHHDLPTTDSTTAPGEPNRRSLVQRIGSYFRLTRRR